MVIEVFRHGARAPYKLENPLNFGSNWEIGAEQLTGLGERQQFLLGQKRRKEYIEDENFLPSIYEPGTIYAESTCTNRTIMSAYSHLYGMYPLEKRPHFKIGENNLYDTVKNYTISYNIPVHVGSRGRGLLDGYMAET